MQGGTRIRVGTDLTAVADVREALAAHGGRYLRRLYTDAEVADCTASAEPVDPARLAARFAAKEATIKVLRPVDEPVPWRSIEVRRDPGGWVELELSGRAAELAERRGVSGLAVSLTHEAGMAGAVVVAEVSR